MRGTEHSVLRYALDIGLTLGDVERWIGSETRVCYRFEEFQRIIKEIAELSGMSAEEVEGME